MLQIFTDTNTTIIAVSLVIIILSIGIIIAIITTKRTQEQNLRKTLQRENEFVQQLMKSQIEVQESTFSTLGKELHDNVAQLLSTAKMLLGIAELNLQNPPDTLKTANETIGAAIAEIRSLSKSLNKEWLEQFDLIENLQTEINRINLSKTIAISFKHPERLDISPETQTILFRIIQEALQNSIKHASATNLLVQIDKEHKHLKVTVKDDGIGLTNTQALTGVGILNMKQRANLLNGSVEWQTSEKGTAVVCVIPL